jgi:hypothetical protein
MICPECKRPTTRLVYDRRGKRCPDCNNPNFIRMVDLVSPPPGFVEVITQMRDVTFREIPTGRVAEPADAYARYHSYRRGWEAGAVARVMDPNFTDHKIATMREEYASGYEEGMKARREMHAATCKRTGYVPSILR